MNKDAEMQAVSDTSFGSPEKELILDELAEALQDCPASSSSEPLVLRPMDPVCVGQPAAVGSQGGIANASIGNPSQIAGQPADVIGSTSVVEPMPRMIAGQPADATNRVPIIQGNGPQGPLVTPSGQPAATISPNKRRATSMNDCPSSHAAAQKDVDVMSQKRKENETLRSELSEAVSKLRDREAWWVQGMSSLKLHEEAEKEKRSQLEKSAEAEWASAIQLFESRTEAAWQTVSQYEAGFEEQKWQLLSLRAEPR